MHLHPPLHVRTIRICHRAWHTLLRLTRLRLGITALSLAMMAGCSFSDQLEPAPKKENSTDSTKLSSGSKASIDSILPSRIACRDLLQITGKNLPGGNPVAMIGDVPLTVLASSPVVIFLRVPVACPSGEIVLMWPNDTIRSKQRLDVWCSPMQTAYADVLIDSLPLVTSWSNQHDYDGRSKITTGDSSIYHSIAPRVQACDSPDVESYTIEMCSPYNAPHVDTLAGISARVDTSTRTLRQIEIFFVARRSDTFAHDTLDYRIKLDAIPYATSPDGTIVAELRGADALAVIRRIDYRYSAQHTLVKPMKQPEKQLYRSTFLRLGTDAKGVSIRISFQ